MRDRRPSPRRSDAFEVLALDGVRSGLLRFCSARESSDWLRAVSANVRQLTLRDVSAGPHLRPFPRLPKITTALRYL